MTLGAAATYKDITHLQANLPLFVCEDVGTEVVCSELKPQEAGGCEI